MLFSQSELISLPPASFDQTRRSSVWFNGLMSVGLLSHVALAQSFVDGQQAGDLLDDDLPGQFDGTVAVVRPLSLRLKPAGFLVDRQTGGGRQQAQRRRSTTWLKVVWWQITVRDSSHCETLTDGGRTVCTAQLYLWTQLWRTCHLWDKMSTSWTKLKGQRVNKIIRVYTLGTMNINLAWTSGISVNFGTFV